MKEFPHNTEERMQFHPEESGKAFSVERFKEKIRTIKETIEWAARLGVLAALFSQLSMYGHENVYARGMDPLAMDVPKKEKVVPKRPVVSEGLIRERVRKERFERMYMQTNLSGSGSYIELARGENTEVSSVTYEDLQAQIRHLEGKTGKKVQKIKLAHGHNRPILEDLGYSAGDIKKMEAGKLESPSVPPSFTDIYSSVAEEYFFKEQGIRIENEVFDSNGKWVYSVEANSETGKLIEIQDEELKLMAKVEVPKELIAMLRQKSAVLLKINPRDQFTTLGKDRDLAEVGERMLEVKRKLGQKYPGTYQEIQDMTFLQGDIYTAIREGRSQNEVQSKTAEYLALMSKYGVKMQYLPNKPHGSINPYKMTKQNTAKR